MLLLDYHIMKKSFYLLLTLLCLGITSCGKMDAWAPYGGAQVFVSSGTPTDYTITQFMKICKEEFGVDMESTMQPVLDVTRLDDLIVRFVPIVYNTVDPLGRSVLASGSITYPVNRAAKGVIDVMPFGYMANTQAASENGLSTEHALVFMRQIVISPDFLDAGISKSPRGDTDLPLGDDQAAEGDCYHPLINMDNSGRVAYDMHVAAAQFFEQELGEKLPKHTSVFGYSEGGSDALAYNRWVDLHDQGNIVIDRTFSGGGAHDLMAAYNYLSGVKSQLYPIFPSLIYSIDYWTPSISLDYTKLYNPDGLLMQEGTETYYRTLLNRKHHYMSTLGSDMTSYLHPNFFKEWTADNEYHKLLPYMKYNNSSADPNWVPRNFIYLFHAVGDKHIPEPCSQSAYESLRAKRCNVYYERNTDYQDHNDPHMDAAIRFFVTACGYFALN